MKLSLSKFEKYLSQVAWILKGPINNSFVTKLVEEVSNRSAGDIR